MQIEEKQVVLRKIMANEGKIIISRKLNDIGIPEIYGKEIYLGKFDSEDNFEEVSDEMLIQYKQKEEESNI